MEKMMKPIDLMISLYTISGVKTNRQIVGGLMGRIKLKTQGRRPDGSPLG
jgi:hypothetical protein